MNNLLQKEFQIRKDDPRNMTSEKISLAKYPTTFGEVPLWQTKTYEYCLGGCQGQRKRPVCDFRLWDLKLRLVCEAKM